MRLLSEKKTTIQSTILTSLFLPVSKTHASQINSANGFYFLPTVALLR